jgi:anti-sigma B factor antagonist
MPLEVTAKEREPGIVVIYPVGSVDSESHDVLQKAVDSILAGEPPRVLIFDMEGVHFISSMGLRVILRARKALGAGSGRLLMTNLRPQIKMVFDLVKALPKERIFASIAELDDYLALMQRKALEEN